MCLSGHFWIGDEQFLCAAAHHERKENANHNDEDNREEDSPKNDHRGPPKNLSHGYLLFQAERYVRGVAISPSPFW
jgi:hypothetical protein